ncbi:hypothetical protein [Arthrobacter sp. A2-55]|uniref:hypothetical protein n=1 Tax=Arthrobacter sp. A2-55 TaxID=2897337 RepID=UPI0021CDCBCC|nr:hypothetical protein [Arthrobacter sp. A2-55]MCU6480511.1 hypothetical protein [Arthrobacter sp. A2-55]
MRERSNISAGQLNRTHIGSTVTIIDPVEGTVTGELRQITHRPKETILHLCRAYSDVPKGKYIELVYSAERSGIGEPLGLVEHTPAIEGPVAIAPGKGKSISDLFPGVHDTADRNTLGEQVVEVHHDGNGSELKEPKRDESPSLPEDVEP